MNPMRKIAVVAGCLGATLTAGAVGASMVGVASAQTDTPPATASGSTAATAPSTGAATAPSTAPTGKPARGPAGGDPSTAGHQANGITETILTGDDATKVTAAAAAAVPGATVDRVETDAEGAAFEAHVTKSDGSKVTVKLDAGYVVTSVEDGMK